MENSQAIATGATAAAAIVMALLFKFFPGIKTWFAKLSPDARGGIQLGIITLAVAIQFGLSYTGQVEIFEMSWDGVFAAVVVWVIALAGNQGTYLTTRKIGAAE